MTFNFRLIITKKKPVRLEISYVTFHEMLSTEDEVHFRNCACH